MKKTIKISLLLAIVIILGVIAIFLIRRNNVSKNEFNNPEPKKIENTADFEKNNTAQNKTASPVQTQKDFSSIAQNVPFTSQAPFGKWSDADFQNGCEEASAIMAMAWAEGDKSITPQFAQKEIKKITELEDKLYGKGTFDASIFDSANFMKQYYKYQKINPVENISVDDIKTELEKGNVVMVPAFGQALGNPNYTQPGPVTHMLLIIGWDDKTAEFITNDPGTRKGEKYRYKQDVLFNAIWQYQTSQKHQESPSPKGMKKGMIVVSK